MPALISLVRAQSARIIALGNLAEGRAQLLTEYWNGSMKTPAAALELIKKANRELAILDSHAETDSE